MIPKGFDEELEAFGVDACSFVCGTIKSLLTEGTSLLGYPYFGSYPDALATLMDFWYSLLGALSIDYFCFAEEIGFRRCSFPVILEW